MLFAVGPRNSKVLAMNSRSSGNVAPATAPDPKGEKFKTPAAIGQSIGVP